MTLSELVKRHGASHYANIKYGYIVFLLAVIHMSYLYISRQIYFKKWIKTGRATSHKRLISLPDTAFLIAWVVVILLLSFYKFELHAVNSFIKRLGRIAYVLIVLDVFVSLKPSPLPDVYYLELIFLHKWLSRIIVLWALAHSIGYTAVWIRADTFSKFFKILNFLGVIAMLLFLISTIVSLRPLRRRFYKLFFTTHLIIAWACVGLIQFHARPGVTNYNIMLAFLFILQIVLKVWKSQDVVIDKKTAVGSTLELITIPNYYRSKPFIPGSHVRLSYPKKNILTYLLPSHPYTVASTPDDANIKLILRKNSYDIKTHQIVSCFGPFPSIHINFFRTAENVLLIAGGAGISYTLGIYQKLIEDPSINVSMVWIMRNRADTWILDHFHVKKIDIFITGGALTSDDPVSRVDDPEEDEQLLENLSSDEFEMESFDAFDDITTRVKPEKNVKLGRPRLESYARLIMQDDRANNWVISCGTGTLNADCKRWADTKGVRFHSEAYDM